MSKGLTLRDLETLAKVDPMIKNFLRRQSITSYVDFIDVLYDDLGMSVRRLEENPQVMQKDTEDSLTDRLLLTLFGMSYRASHDCQRGGHVDMTVELHRHVWVGEAKIFTSVADLKAGFLQLTTRYRGQDDMGMRAYGGLIAYVRRDNAAAHMATWRQQLPVASLPVKVGVSDCPRRGNLAFFSEHLHQDLGIPIQVWHLGVALNFAPKDRSATKRKTA